MFGYEKDGIRGTIMLSHVIFVGLYDGQKLFNVFVDDGTDEPYKIPVEYYDDFKNEMFKYSHTKETK
ncbi:hypothetical protein HOR11_gp082 [Lactobacillus phage SA-C12]|uniref:Uncharacterized protein n=1 Tax=Lactobacillus phage SA-C12 TaxID=1755697 RepID=A0A1I9KKB1_9CAUD|nr:hypothetical protein HOR11_gp082 [Lactobacillus phage SA-C12]ALY06903.1 hypothetical protein SAC12_082 [Lactobacillus phage SA-C12]